MRFVRPAFVALCTLVFALPCRGEDPAGVRTFRLGMPIVAETLDPARTTNGQAGVVVAAIFDTLVTLDPLAPRASLVPLAAAAPPEVAPGYRAFTFRLRHGILFTDDPAFGGKPRELVAADFAYAIRRLVDPAVASPWHYLVDGKIAGLDALAAHAREARRPLDYDAPVEGLRVLDRYTLRITLAVPDPAFGYVLANSALAAVPREAVEARGSSFGQHPVGTGAFVLAAMTPGDRIVLVRNPRFRALRFDDLLAPSSLAAYRTHPSLGQRLPGVDRIEITSVAEVTAASMAVRKGELDLTYAVSSTAVMDGDALKPAVAADGVAIARWQGPDLNYLFVNMRDPVLGGVTRERIALRRAIFMAFDDAEFSQVFDGGRSVLPQQIVPPGISGFIEGYRYPNHYDPAAANALLDRFGYRPGSDGMRRNPGGSKLVARMMVGTSSESRRYAEFVKRKLDAIGIAVAFDSVNVTDRMQRMIGCAYGMTMMDWGLDVPDGLNAMVMFYSKAAEGANGSCHADAAFDADYEAAAREPEGPRRDALFRSMEARIDALAPARPIPTEPPVSLKRRDVLGPFGTAIDPLQLWTLAFARGPGTPTR